MKKRKWAVAMDNERQRTDNCLESKTLRLKETAFTRQRDLGPKRIIHLILNRLVQALQLQIDQYYAQIGQRPVSKQALSQARANLNPVFIRGYADDTAEIAARDEEMPTYQQMRLIGIDGTTVAVENTEELREAFGCAGERETVATARASTAYDVLGNVIYDSQIGHYKTDERVFARMHKKRLRELGLADSLLLFDRGYFGNGFIADLIEDDFHFLMRMRRRWNQAADAVASEGIIAFMHEGKSYSVRVLKATLSTGEVETLITSLSEEQLPKDEAGELYFCRWRVETALDLLKSKLQLENFSGKTETSVLQDFYATIYLANLVAFAAQEADEIIAQQDQSKQLKYSRKANRNRTVAKVREKFLCMVLEPDPRIREAMMDNIVASIACYPVSVVPNRSPPRRPPRRKRFHMNRKPPL